MLLVLALARSASRQVRDNEESSITTEGAVVNARTVRDSIVTSRLSGFPALSVLPGQSLLKDMVLLGAAIWSLGEDLNARSR